MLKSGEFSVIAAALKHYRKIRSRRERSYIKAFPRRRAKLRKYVDVARACIYTPESVRGINTLLQELRPALVIVNNKLYSQIDRLPGKSTKN